MQLLDPMQGQVLPTLSKDSVIASSEQVTASEDQLYFPPVALMTLAFHDAQRLGKLIEAESCTFSVMHNC